jgi:hypothetical protein
VYDRRAAGAAFLLGAAKISSEDDPLTWATRGAIALPHDAVVVPRYFHPLVEVVRSCRAMLLETEAHVMHHGWHAGQNLD